MDNSNEATSEKKTLSKAKSHVCPGPLRLKSEPAKRKSFDLNEAVKSLDLALGRLKKSRLGEAEEGAWRRAEGRPSARLRVAATPEPFMEVCPSAAFGPGPDNASLMSMNFSHYELVRNVSRSTADSDGAFSGNTCSARPPTPADPTLKDEHLEKYFRSVELWTSGYEQRTAPLHFDVK